MTVLMFAICMGFSCEPGELRAAWPCDRLIAYAAGALQAGQTLRVDSCEAAR
jgi:hypothetical protein